MPVEIPDFSYCTIFIFSFILSDEEILPTIRHVDVFRDVCAVGYTSRLSGL